MSTRLLVTGFPSFYGCPENPSQLLVEWIRTHAVKLPGVELLTEILPVEYAGVEREFLRCLKEYQPDVWLAFGASRRTIPLHLECLARNLDQCERPDNTGEVRSGTVIVPDGPAELISPYALDHLEELLNGAGIETTLSENAGSYICNHLQYFAHWHLQQSRENCQFLFTHLASAETGFTAEKLWPALQIMAMWFQNERSKMARSGSVRI
ncbi:hypothetical protein SH661x_000480 [Planctomicrobium sp. SH661]|uniref:pyroglutamyl-peptidase I family protein n=1 Tax=Planctomicrobium sp. SH661 TaxID=3448124 RepID=UPI003F5C1B5D